MHLKPVIAITHASFSPERRFALDRLMSQLRTEATEMPVVIACDEKRQGSLWCWRQAHELALSIPGATHVVWLPDDAIVCDDFGKMVLACIKAKPAEVFDCFVNHPGALDVNTTWYTTSDGYTGVGGVMPVDLLREHLAWRDAHPELGDYPNDAGVNLWAIVTRRLIHKTACSLVTHDTKLPSLDGHGGQGHGDRIERQGLKPVAMFRQGVRADIMNFLGRTFANPDKAKAAATVDLGRTYAGNVWDVVRRLEPSGWDVDAMYQAYEPVPEGGRPRVVIVVPIYRETAEVVDLTTPSREAVAADLEEHGVECLIVRQPGESHVDRMRQRGTHLALKLGATHLLWWDADISCDDPKTVRRMLLSEHDVVAGACPFRDGSGRVVCNLPPETEAAIKAGTFQTLPGGYVEVMHAGTGFMLIRRRALVTMMQARPDLLHLSRGAGDRGEPLWALWDATIVGPPPGSMPWADLVRLRAFETEDWMFCRLWQEFGGKVYVHVPSTFRHYGTHGHRGSFETSFGLARTP